MRPINNFYSSFRHWHRADKALYSLGVMVFFWAVFDGVLGYLVPLVITNTGISETVMGIIFGSSSIFGGIFDFLLSKIFRRSSFKKLFFIMFIVCMIYPLVLWQAKTIPIFLIAMALWGLYYDLSNFGDFDFVGRRKNEEGHAKEFGIISVFKSLGYIIAPILSGLLIVGTVVEWHPFVFSWIIIGVSFGFFLLLLSATKGQFNSGENGTRPVNVLRELKIWRHIGKIIFPALVMTMLLNILDAFFWTIGPLLAESFSMLHPLNGLFLTAYTLPPLIVGWSIAKITNRFGKKKTSFLSFFCGSVVLVAFYIFHNPFILMGLIFLAALFFGLSWPAIDSAYADYISESDLYEKNIEGLEDFATNIGYVIGPILAGFLADTLGNINAFSILGLDGLCICLLLFIWTPKHITIPQKA